MYKSIFLSDQGAYDAVKRQSVVLQAHDPFNMVVIDDASKLVVDNTKVKNTFTFADLDEIPGNRAILKTYSTNKSSHDAALTWLRLNKIVIVEDLYNMNMIIVEIPRGSYTSFANLLTTNLTLDYVEQDFITKVEVNYAIPYTSHWHLNGIQAQCAWDAMAAAGVSNAEEPSCGPTPFTLEALNCCTKPEVALLDQGVQRFHPDLHGMLSGCAWDSEAGYFEEDYNWNVVNNNNNIDPQSPYENHGTAMAGVIAANNLNYNYTLSPAQNYIRVQVLKVLYVASVSSGTPPVYTGNSATVQGINRAVQNPRCAAINMSFVSSVPHVPVEEAIEYARTQGRAGKGIPVFAAAGNGPCNGGCPAVADQIKYPAAYSYANAVGACGQSYTKMSWSDFGTKLFIAAPGTGIWTTDRTGTVGYSTASSSTNADINSTNLATFSGFGGTSAASGIVSSIAACMVAVNPDITAEQIETIIGDTAAETGGYVYDPVTGKSPELGHGVIKMCDAITEVIDQMDSPSTVVLTLNITSSAITTTTCGTATVTFTLSAEDDNWNGATQMVYNVYASPYPTVDLANATLLNPGGYIPLVESGSYTLSFAIPNNSSLVSSTDYLILVLNLIDANGEVVANITSTPVDGANSLIVQDSIGMTLTNGCATPGVDLAVQVLSYSTATNNLGQTNRTFRVKYTNTGTVAITAFNRSYGWVGGTNTTNTQTYPGTTSSNGPLLPGQSRTVNISFTGSNTPPQYPATYYHQINTVNGAADANSGNNNSTIVVTQ